MNKLICAIVLSTLSLSGFAKSVKENEIGRSQNVVALFNKACMEAYLDEDELSSFLFNNNFEDLNDETPQKEDTDKSKEKKTNILDLSKNGRHYSIVNDKKLFFLDITDETCSVLVKTINQDVFNAQFKEFRKGLTDELFTEIGKSFETRTGSTTYKVTAYFYSTQEEGETLPFQLYLTQTNAKNVPYQLRLSVHIDKRKEILNKKSKFVSASLKNMKS